MVCLKAFEGLVDFQIMRMNENVNEKKILKLSGKSHTQFLLFLLDCKEDIGTSLKQYQPKFF